MQHTKKNPLKYHSLFQSALKYMITKHSFSGKIVWLKEPSNQFPVGSKSVNPFLHYFIMLFHLQRLYCIKRDGMTIMDDG
jgi:hypothetical protein